MSQQTLDLKTSLRTVLRHKLILGFFVALGLLAGTGYAALSPPMPRGEALVVLPGTVRNTATHVVIAGSDPVLSRVLPSMHPSMSLPELRKLVRVKSLTSNIISISASGKTAAGAEGTANAIAASYASYVNSASSPVGRVRARILQRATTVTTTSMAVRMLQLGGAGLLAGVLVGAAVALAVSRTDRRLRERAQIADYLGVPVLASIPVAHPRDVAGWAKLLEGYAPGGADAWRLRKVLQTLGLDPGSAGGDSGGSSLAVLSLSADHKALALGPQLAVFAATLGIPTALVVGFQQHGKATAALAAGCAAAQVSAKRPAELSVAVSDHGTPRAPGAVLTVVVAVVDGKDPQFPHTLRPTASVLGVSTGAATAEQLARVAARAAADGQLISGILVADPDSADHTTGRLPQPAWPARLITSARTHRTASETTR